MVGNFPSKPRQEAGYRIVIYEVLVRKWDIPTNQKIEHTKPRELLVEKNVSASGVVGGSRWAMVWRV